MHAGVQILPALRVLAYMVFMKDICRIRLACDLL